MLNTISKLGATSAALAMTLFSMAGPVLHAGVPAKTAPPPKASAGLLHHATQGNVRVLVQVYEAAPKGINVSAVRATNAVAIDFARASPHAYDAIPFLAMTVDASELLALQNDPRIAGITEDRMNEIVLTDTMPLIGATPGWSAGFTGAGHSIAILDTGFDTSHPMLLGKVAAEACFSSTQNGSTSLCPNGQTQQIGAGAAINCNPLSGGSMGAGCQHGTHVAGIALGSSAVLSGVAPGANLVAIQIFSKITCGQAATPCLTAWDSDILKGLDQAYAWRNLHHIAAINMSLGGGAYTTQTSCDANGAAYRDMFALFNYAGIPVVVAAGNGANKNALTTPACLTGAISAGATTKTDTIAEYSNSADFLSLLAPGDYIFSSVPGGYTTMRGTSMAAPHIAGALTVLKSKMPNASVMQLLETLQNTGEPIVDARPGANNRVKKRIALMTALNALDTNWKSDTFEPDDTPAQSQAIALAAPQTHRFGMPDDRDWAVFQAQAGHIYRIETLNLSGATDTMLDLYAGVPDGIPVASNDDVDPGIDRRSIITYTAISDGPLYVQMQDWDDAAFLNTRFDAWVTQIGVATPAPSPSPSATPDPSQTPAPTTTPSPTTQPKFKWFLPFANRSQ